MQRTLFHCTTEENWLGIQASGFLEPRAFAPMELPVVYLGTRNYCISFSVIWRPVLLEVTIDEDWISRRFDGSLPRGPEFLIRRPIPVACMHRVPIEPTELV